MDSISESHALTRHGFIVLISLAPLAKFARVESISASISWRIDFCRRTSLIQTRPRGNAFGNTARPEQQRTHRRGFSLVSQLRSAAELLLPRWMRGERAAFALALGAYNLFGTPARTPGRT